MERGDIGEFSIAGQACVFDQLLASSPTNISDRMKERFHIAKGDWESALKLWKPNDAPLKSMIDHVKRLGISTVVVTFLSPDAVEPVYRWLLRKGVSTTVEFYESPAHFGQDLKYNHSLRNVYVPDQEMSAVLGVRATCVSPTTIWSL